MRVYWPLSLTHTQRTKARKKEKAGKQMSPVPVCCVAVINVRGAARPFAVLPVVRPPVPFIIYFLYFLLFDV